MNTLLITKTLNYKTILKEIAEERGLEQLAKYIESFQYTDIKEPVVYNITKMPESTCDGCQ